LVFAVTIFFSSPFPKGRAALSAAACSFIGNENIVYVAAKPTGAIRTIETDQNPVDGLAGKPSSYVALYWAPLVQRDVPAVPEPRMHGVPILVYGTGPPQAPAVGCANAGNAMVNIITAITSATATNNAMRLIDATSLSLATSGGLL
jgi:hypothetical protein